MSVDKSPVEIAADSPDPLIRGLARRRMEAAVEIERIDTFLGMYVTDFSDYARYAEKPATEVKGGRRPPSPTSKASRMVDAARAIVLAAGRPMKTAELHVELKARHPDICPEKADSVRIRLAERKDAIANLNGRGYWPIGVPAPVDATVVS